MQFAWLILIPITLVNILLTGLIYLVVNSLGLGNLTNFVFLTVTACRQLGHALRIHLDCRAGYYGHDATRPGACHSRSAQ